MGSQTIRYSSNRNVSHSYDAAGNTTNDGVHTYAYNAENQQVSMDGGAATYAYDGECRRMKKTTSAETTYTFYGPGGILCEFSTVNTGATAAASADRTLYRTSERTGTAVLLFTTAGTVIENNRTLPYGEAWLSDVASANDKKFATYDRDKESGLDYAMARMYGNTGGRFTTPDQGPIAVEKPSSLNRYAYGALDPINKRDPSGNSWMEVDPWSCSFFGGAAYHLQWWWTAGGMTTFNAAYICDLPDVPNVHPGWFAYAYMFGYPLGPSPEFLPGGGAGGQQSSPRIGNFAPFTTAQRKIVDRAIAAAKASVANNPACAALFGTEAEFLSNLNSLNINPSSVRDSLLSEGEWENDQRVMWAYGVIGTTNVYLVDRFFELNDIAKEAFGILHEVWHVNAPTNKDHIDNRRAGGGIEQLEKACNVTRTPLLFKQDSRTLLPFNDETIGLCRPVRPRLQELR